MGKSKPLKILSSMVKFPDGSVKPLADLTAEECKLFYDNISRRISDNMSLYYTQHPENYRSFLKAMGALDETQKEQTSETA